MLLLTTFRDEARRRGLLGAGEAVTAAVAVRLVRDMPYASASDREAETAVREWRGTAGEKHELLALLLEELGCAVSIIVATQEITPANAPWLPPPLRDEVGRAPLPDVHTFLRVSAGPEEQWGTVDATWPLAARALGLPANETFRPGVDQRAACDPIEIFHVPADANPAQYRERISADHVGEQAERHARFVEALSAWLAERLGA